MVLGLCLGLAGALFLTGFLVGYLTIEDEKKEKRGRRSFAGPEEISVLERDFDGYVLNKRIHSVSWFRYFSPMLCIDGSETVLIGRCEANDWFERQV